MFNTEEEKHVLTECLRRSGNVKDAIDSIDRVLAKGTPFALYIATLDKSNCMWIFDENTLYEMLGGVDIHKKTFSSIFEEEWERESGVLLYVMRKVGPIVAVRLSKKFLTDVRNSLELNIP